MWAMVLLVLGFVLYLGFICPRPSKMLLTALTTTMVRVLGASDPAWERRHHPKGLAEAVRVREVSPKTRCTLQTSGHPSLQDGLHSDHSLVLYHPGPTFKRL